VVGSHLDLDLASLWNCPALINMGGTIRATPWLCDAVKYQWKFERMLNGQLFLQNGNPVVIEGYGVTGTRDYVVTAANGFGAGTEWRVQIRPVFANNVVGQYYTLYQCMKLKGTAAAAPMADFSEEEKATGGGEMTSSKLLLYPNPSMETAIHLKMQFEGEAVVMMMDVSGRLINQSQWINDGGLNEFTVEPGQLANGVYWVELELGEEKIRQRWVKQ
jgi:hypothetical protein